jgi:hypothetical protein
VGGRLTDFSLALLAIGIGCFFALPSAIDGYFRQRNMPEWVTRQSFLVQAGDEPFGWLDVEYPRTMRENQDAPINVIYRINGINGTWDPPANIEFSKGQESTFKTLKLQLSLMASHFSVAPEPLEYRFDVNRIIERGNDNHIWTIAPKGEGEYTLVFSLVVEPRDFRGIRLGINGEKIDDGVREVSLPVTVYTKYSVPSFVVELWKGAGAVLSFLLVLPAAKMVFDWALAKRSGGGRRRSGKK